MNIGHAFRSTRLQNVCGQFSNLTYMYQKNLTNTTHKTMVPPYDGNFDVRAITAAQLFN